MEPYVDLPSVVHRSFPMFHKQGRFVFKRGREVPAGSVGPTRARGHEKVTPEPMSLHGDFPEIY